MLAKIAIRLLNCAFICLFVAVLTPWVLPAVSLFAFTAAIILTWLFIILMLTTSDEDFRR